MGALAGLVERGLVAAGLGRRHSRRSTSGSRRWGSSCGPRSRPGGSYLPAGDHILRAFQRPLADVRVLIVGQDPYPTPGHPIGLSLRGRARRPAAAGFSLRNIYQELGTDLGLHDAGPRRPDGLGRPGRDAAQPGAHRAAGRRRLAPRPRLGGGHLVRHRRAGPPWRPRSPRSCGAATPSRSRPSSVPSRGSSRSHPSPLSATAGSSAPAPSRRVNRLLEEQGGVPLDWSLPGEAEIPCNAVFL